MIIVKPRYKTGQSVYYCSPGTRKIRKGEILRILQIVFDCVDPNKRNIKYRVIFPDSDVGPWDLWENDTNLCETLEEIRATILREYELEG